MTRYLKIIRALICGAVALEQIAWVCPECEALAPWHDEQSIQKLADDATHAASDSQVLTPDNFTKIHAGLVRVQDCLYEILLSPLASGDAEKGIGAPYTNIKIVKDIKSGNVRVLKLASHREAQELQKMNFPYIVKVNIVAEGNSTCILDMPYLGDPRLVGQKNDPYTLHNSLRKKSFPEQIAAWRKILATFQYLHQQGRPLDGKTFLRHIRFTETGEPVLYTLDILKTIDESDTPWYLQRIGEPTPVGTILDNIVEIIPLLQDLFPDISLGHWKWTQECMRVNPELIYDGLIPDQQLQRLERANDNPALLIADFIEDVEGYFAERLDAKSRLWLTSPVFEDKLEQIGKAIEVIFAGDSGDVYFRRGGLLLYADHEPNTESDPKNIFVCFCI